MIFSFIFVMGFSIILFCALRAVRTKALAPSGFLMGLGLAMMAILGVFKNIPKENKTITRINKDRRQK